MTAETQGGGDAGDEPAASDRHHDGRRVRRFGDQFEADGALAGDHEGMVERRHDDELPLLRVAPRCVHGFVVELADEAHGRPVRLGGVHLGGRGVDGHEHGGLDSRELGGQCHALGVVAGRGGDDLGARR